MRRRSGRRAYRSHDPYFLHNAAAGIPINHLPGQPPGPDRYAWAVPPTSGLEALGSPTEYRYDSPDAGVLEVFDNPYPASTWAVVLLCQEFTSLCPVTGQPDYGRLRIDYVPARHCVESKSLKLYLMRYRNEGAFHEACVNRVADDLAEAIAPRYLRVYGDFNPRGGIAIKPLAVRAAPGLDAREEERCLALLAQAAGLAVT
jgi:7-cyano-7-deazaguanine reductase